MGKFGEHRCDTEERMIRTPPDTRIESASPPCSLHDAPPSYSGFATPAEVSLFLVVLSETLQSVARALATACRRAPPPPPPAMAVLVPAVGRSVKATALVRRHLRRLSAETGAQGAGAAPDPAAGPVLEHLRQILHTCNGLAADLQVMRPRIQCDRLHADLMAVNNHLLDIATSLAGVAESDVAANGNKESKR